MDSIVELLLKQRAQTRLRTSDLPRMHMQYKASLRDIGFWCMQPKPRGTCNIVMQHCHQEGIKDVTVYKIQQKRQTGTAG